MTIIGQPEAYSDVLERVFTTTILVGVACTAVLATASPELRELLNSVHVNADVGPVKELKLLYVAIPALVAVASRIVKLHDRISDVLRLRHVIDIQWILLPLAEKAGVELDDAKRLAIRFRRTEAMYRVFYPFVSLPEAKIDRQLVRTALDNFGWLWVIIEAIFLFLVTAVLLVVLNSTHLAWILSAVAATLVLIAVAQWFACKRASSAEVTAVLEDSDRAATIRTYFDSI